MGRFVEDIGVDGERLEIAAVDAGLEAGLFELRGDVVGGLVDALGARSAALAGVGSQEGDVAAQPRLGLDAVPRRRRHALRRH